MKRALLLIAGLMLTSTIGSTQTGCSSPSVPTAQVSTTSAGLVFHATAQKATANVAGIAKWHSIVEHSSGAVVVDGVDANGKLKFSSSFRSLSNGHFQIQDHIAKTELTFDKHGKVISSSLTPSWQKTAALYSKDWNAFQQTVPYGTWGYVSAGLWVVAGAAAVVAGVAALPVVAAGVAAAGTIAAVGTIVGGVAGIAAATTGAVDLYQSDKASAQAADANAAQTKAMQDQIDTLKTQMQANPSTSSSSSSSSSGSTDGTSSSSSSGSTGTDGTDGTSSSSSSGDDGTTNADNSGTSGTDGTQSADNSGTDNGTSGTDGTQVADNSTDSSSTDQQGTDLPAADDSASSNLDTANLGSDSSSDNSQVADNSASDNSASDNSAASSGDDDSSASSGDDDTSTASLAFKSGDLVAYSTGKCLKSLKSKSSGITVCAHY